MTEIFCGVVCMIVGRRGKLCALPKCCTPICSFHSLLLLQCFTMVCCDPVAVGNFTNCTKTLCCMFLGIVISFLVHFCCYTTLLSSCYSYHFHLIESTTKAKRVTVRPNWWAMGRKIVHYINSLFIYQHCQWYLGIVV